MSPKPITVWLENIMLQLNEIQPSLILLALLLLIFW